MMTDAPNVVVEVPATDAVELSQLVGLSANVGRSYGLDGSTIVQAMVMLNWTTYRLLRTWLMARTQKSISTQIIWNGKEFSGFTAEEVAGLLERIRDEVTRVHGDETNPDAPDAVQP